MPSLLPIPNPVTGVMNAIADGAGDRFKDMVISLSKMVIEGAAWVFGQLIERISTSTTPNLEAGWFKHGPYAQMLGVAAFLLAIMLVLGICHAVASGDPGATVRRVVVEAPSAVLGLTVLIMVTTFGIALTDALSNELMAGTATPVKEFVKTMTERSTRELALSPAVVMGLSAFVMLIGSLVIWAELLVRSALIYLRDGIQRGPLAEGLVGRRGVDLAAWSENEWGNVLGTGGPLRFRPGTGPTDPFGRSWELDGDPRALDLEVADGGIRYGDYPDALERLWGCMHAPRCGDLVLSAEPGYTFGEVSGGYHKASDHGSLHAEDSHVFMLAGGFGEGEAAPRRITDVAPMLLDHFGAGKTAEPSVL